MTLLEKQKHFPVLLSHLINFATNQGYDLTLGEAWRSDETAELYAKAGKGIRNSLHGLRLAIDLNLFRGGVYLTNTEAYLPLGEYWESLSYNGVECAWGGRFEKADGNHFSIAHNGVR